MKRIIYIFIGICLFILAISLFSQPLVIFLAKKQLKSLFKESSVLIGGCSFKPTRLLVLSDVEIKRKEIYGFKLKNIKISYDILSILKGAITKCTLDGVTIDINLPKNNIIEFKNYLNISSKMAFLIKNFELSEVNFNVKSKDLSISGSISLNLDLAKQFVNYFDAKISVLEGYGVNLNEASLKISQFNKEGELLIDNVKYNKLKITKLKGNVKLEKDKLFLENMFCNLLSGELKLDASLSLNKEYVANLNLSNLDIDEFVKDLELEEKFEMTGKLGGSVVLNGEGQNISLLTGELLTVSGGGMLVIKDDKFLKNMARNSGQSLEIVVESFKNYHYNNGTAKLFLDKGNLVFDVILEGEAGKRNLNITLHDFTLN